MRSERKLFMYSAISLCVQNVSCSCIVRYLCVFRKYVVHVYCDIFVCSERKLFMYNAISLCVQNESCSCIVRYLCVFRT